jgi:thioredoxin
MSDAQMHRVIDLSSAVEFSEEDGGTVCAHFAPLDIHGRGATQDEAFHALTEQLGAILQTDDAARAEFSKWAEGHVVDHEPTAEEVAAEIDISPRARSAQAPFRELTAATFDEAIASSKPVLVDFWAPWCRPCLMAAPVLEEIHASMPEDFDVAKVNVDEQPQLQARYGFRGIPCFILFRNGAEVDRINGLPPKAQFRSAIVDLLSRA